ncbi:hypothetical protein [Synechococcus sp. UW105]|uniref:hypothetical protein n=1 Tax=Synechococcus sp. UW105 TaxID=337067 RepID=UPI000E0EFD83|nr:hypothetical protein [Synechococcus sp. UW105]
MANNYTQILDGIDDQIADLRTTQPQYELQMAALQAAIEEIPARIADLEDLKTQTMELRVTQVDVNLNLRLTGLISRQTVLLLVRDRTF